MGRKMRDRITRGWVVVNLGPVVNLDFEVHQLGSPHLSHCFNYGCGKVVNLVNLFPPLEEMKEK